MTTHPLLDRFAPWLREHSVDTERVLAPWLSALAAAVGQIAERREPDPSGEPTGFSGLVRRGPYDRLLMSEWLLADELPDEFLRRAVDQEHLFVELDRRQPHRAPWTVVLCDLGPDQLGGPRLVHLALLLVLATRRHAPERLAVGALQDGELFEPPLAEATGRQLARARTRERPTADHARGWLDRLDALGERPELWVVGGEGTERLSFARVNRVIVREEWQTGALEVRVERAGGARARVVLPPPPHDAGRVLEDPFSARRVTVDGDVEHVSATYAISRWLFLKARRGGQERMIALASPKGRGRGGRETIRMVRPNETLVAAGRMRKKAVSLWATEHDLGVEHHDGAVLRIPLPPGFVVRADAPLAPLFGNRQILVTVDAADQVWSLDFGLSRATRLGERRGPLWLEPHAAIWGDGGPLVRWVAGGGATRLPWAARPLTPLVDSAAIGVDHDGRQVVYTTGLGVRPFAAGPLPPALDWPAWFPSYRQVLGVTGRDLRRLVHHPERGWEESRVYDLGPGPIVWAGADPMAVSYAVLQRALVTFFGPDGAPWASWSRW